RSRSGKLAIPALTQSKHTSYRYCQYEPHPGRGTEQVKSAPSFSGSAPQISHSYSCSQFMVWPSIDGLLSNCSNLLVNPISHLLPARNFFSPSVRIMMDASLRRGWVLDGAGEFASPGPPIKFCDCL